MLVSGNIPNMIQGISQQPDSLRLPTQGQLQENCYSSVVEGLEPRKPTQHLAKIFSGSIGNCFTHVINRDSTHRYAVIIRNGVISVSDLAGNIKTVNTPHGVGYITNADPRSTFRAVTIADYTFILNKTVIPAMSATLSPNRGKEGLIFVKQGAYGSVYNVIVNGASAASYTTSTTVVTDLQTDNIANNLVTGLNTNLGAAWTIQRVGSVIWIKKNDGSDFTLTCTDSQAGASMQTFKDVTQSFGSLPVTAPNGFTIGVNAIPGQVDEFAYYVQFHCNSVSATFAEGTWQECAKQGLKNTIDPSTMPFALVDNNDGTFTFDQVAWLPRVVGDTTSDPDPSFVGAPINDIFFFKNRLGFLSDENVILSEVGQYFNFYETTAATLIDSDVIDTAAHTNKVSILRHAVPFNTQALLFSDQTQFIMQGTPLTSKTIQIDKTTDFESNLIVKPFAAGRTVYFVTNKDQFHGLREYYVDDNNTQVNDAVDVGAHVPSYVPAGAFKLAGSTIEDVVCLATTGDPSALYVYKYHWDKDTKIQSSWSRWTFGTGATVLGMEFIETTLYLVIQRGDGVYLESLSVAPGQVDLYATYVTHLDRRLTDVQCTSVVYDPVANWTTFTLPYAPDDTCIIVTRATAVNVLAPGRIIPWVTQAGNTIRVNGDFHTTPVWIGNQYTQRFQFSHFFVRRSRTYGAQPTVDNSGRLQIRTVTLVFGTTGFFQVLVTPAFRSTSTYVFTGKVLGDGSNMINSVSLVDGKKRFLVLSKNDAVTIEINSNSFLPFHMMSAEWEGDFVTRSQPV